MPGVKRCDWTFALHTDILAGVFSDFGLLYSILLRCKLPPPPLFAQAPEDAPPATFALAILTPEEVDVVDLVANTRTLWRRSGSQEWESTAVNP